MVTIVQSLLIIKQMVHRIFSKQCWYEDQYFDLNLVTQKQ